MPAFVDLLKDTFLSDERFCIFFKAVGHWGGPNDGSFSVLSQTAAKSAIEALSARLATSKPESSAPDWSEDVCYAAKPNNFAIQADGRIEKCTLALNKPANHVGKLNLDGSMSFRNEVHQKWLHGWKTMDGDTLSCPVSSATQLFNAPHENPAGLRDTDIADRVSGS
jgi:uncharacterized protein